MPSTLKIDRQDGLASVRLSKRNGNSIDDALVDDLFAAVQELDADPKVKGVLLAAEGKLFSPGLDLQELVLKDRAEMERFIRRFSACVLSLYTFPKPMVAAIHSHAVAGGCVLALTADWRVLSEQALIGLNEVKVGVPFPFGVSMILRESVTQNALTEVALLGRNYRGSEALAPGLVHEVQAAAGFEEACLERLASLARRDSYAFSVTKRYLRSTTEERMRAHDTQFIGEFLDGWFAETTQERIREVAAKLGNS